MSNAPTTITFSEDQAEAYDAITEVMAKAGVDMLEGHTTPLNDATSQVMAIVG